MKLMWGSTVSGLRFVTVVERGEGGGYRCLIYFKKKSIKFNLKQDRFGNNLALGKLQTILK